MLHNTLNIINLKLDASKAASLLTGVDPIHAPLKFKKINKLNRGGFEPLPVNM